MTPVDLRQETFERFGSTLARFGPTPQVPSQNLKVVLDSLASGTLAPIAALSAKIEAGDATGAEEEMEQVYAALPVLLAHIFDLTAMCHRREQALAECSVGVGA